MTRRDCVALAALSLASSSCGRKKGTGYPGYALIATSGENSLAIVDLLKFRLLKPIPLGAPPTAILPRSSGRQTCVLTPSSGSLHIVSANLERLASRKLADELSELRSSPDGKMLITISSASRELLFVDSSSLDVVRRVRLRESPVDIDVSPTGSVAVSLGTGGGIELVESNGSHSQVQLEGEVGSVRFRSDGKLLIACKPVARSLTCLNAPALQILADLPLAMQPQNLCFTPDGGQLFVTGEGMDAVAIVFPYNTLEVEQTVLAGRDPGVMACSATPSYLLVASNSGSDLSILDIDRRRIIAVLEVGLQPHYITLTPDNQYALILNVGSADMAVIRIPAIRLNRPVTRHASAAGSKNGAALFTLLPVGEKPVHAAVVPRV